MALTRRQTIILGTAALVAPRMGFAAANGHAGAVFTDGGRAIRGSDPVGYFESGAPVAGADDITSTWMDATWHFASAANKAKFDADPMAYAPQYGGYCAFAASKGAAAATDPNAWTIHEGKLYLNYSLNVRTIWQEDIPGNIALADENWPAILQALTA